MIKLTLQGTPPSLNVWSRMHWAKAAKIKKQWENDILYTLLTTHALRAGEQFPYKKANIKITYYFATNRRRDADNLNLKFLLDGIVKAGIIKDDSTNVIGQVETSWGVDKAKPRVEIEIREIRKE
jgi:Holliday junction resolvase RusA-like endonuclease